MSEEEGRPKPPTGRPSGESLAASFLKINGSLDAFRKHTERAQRAAAEGARLRRPTFDAPPEIISPALRSARALEEAQRQLAAAAEERAAERRAQTEREEAMVDALEGVLGALRKQERGGRQAAAVGNTTLAFAWLALIAAVVATAWTITGAWEWTVLSGMASAVVCICLAGLLGVFNREGS